MEDIQAEVDLFIGAFLKQESLEKDKKEEYETINQQSLGSRHHIRTSYCLMI